MYMYICVYVYIYIYIYVSVLDFVFLKRHALHIECLKYINSFLISVVFH